MSLGAVVKDVTVDTDIGALPDPLLYGAQLWSDSVLQSLYDAIHAVAVTGAGATSLVHEAKVDIVTTVAD